MIYEKPLRLLILFVMLWNINYSFGQSASVIDLKHIIEIKPLIRKYFEVDRKFVDSACLNTVVFLKFNLNRKGVNNLTFSNDAPAPIIAGLKSAFSQATRELKISSNDEMLIANRSYILPIIFYYQSGCVPQGQLVTSVQDSVNMKLQSRFRNIDEPMHRSLQNMLDFKNGEKNATIDCIIISPLVLGMMN